MEVSRSEDEAYVGGLPLTLGKQIASVKICLKGSVGGGRPLLPRQHKTVCEPVQKRT